MVDEFALNYAKKIWPSVSKKTRLITDYGRQRTKYTILGRMGTETIDLIDCKAEFAKWGYAPEHDMLICILDKSPYLNFLVKWDGTGWPITEPPVNNISNWTPRAMSFIGHCLVRVGNWLIKCQK